jgi:hypothetical protein
LNEFKNYLAKREFKNYLAKRGVVVHEVTVPYSPCSNVRAERINQTIVEMTKANLSQSGLDVMWWGEALQYAFYTYNRVDHVSLEARGRRSSSSLDRQP